MRTGQCWLHHARKVNAESVQGMGQNLSEHKVDVKRQILGINSPEEEGKRSYQTAAADSFSHFPCKLPDSLFTTDAFCVLGTSVPVPPTQPLTEPFLIRGLTKRFTPSAGSLSKSPPYKDKFSYQCN